MNISPFWATIVLCFPALGCHLAGSPWCSAPSCLEVACSGIAPAPNSVSKTSTAARIPYGFRWDAYQGADIEHDIYGDRERSFARRPICRKCGPKVASYATTCQDSKPATNCGCEQNVVLSPPVPEPAPVQESSPIPAEPLLPEPALIDPIPVVPPAVEPTPEKETAPADSPPVEAATEPGRTVPMLENKSVEPTFVPPRNEIPGQAIPKAQSKNETIAPSEPQSTEPRPNSSRRLSPTQIVPTEPPAGLPVPRNDLRRNTIPANPPGDSGSGAKGNVTGFLYDLLLGPQK